MFKPTKQQQSAIDTRGSVLITAAAGSGKTAVLVERVVKMLCREKNPVSVDRLLIVTFTNAAAAEMRLRIEKRLHEEAAKNPADRTLRRQLLLLPSAKICTIDTFCINLVRENFEHFGISPDFKIITDTELYPLYETAVNEILDEYYETEHERILQLLEVFGCGGDDRRLIDAVLKIFGYAVSMPFPEHWFSGCKRMYEQCEQTAESLWRQKLIELSSEELFDSEEDAAALKMLAPCVITLIEIVEKFYSRLLSLMCEKNTLTFYNTEQMALSLLSTPDGSPTEQAITLSEEFDEILVDEYQDVNDLQDTLFYVLSSFGKKLFAVGDVKQSIYGFRGANPENFMRKKDDYVPLDSNEDKGKKIVLSSNFRSRAGVCEYINYLFSLTMSRRFGGVDYNDDERLIPAASFPQNDGADVSIELLNTGDGDDADAVAEAKHIAAYIQKTMSEAPFLREGEGLRAARYGDFAILMRSPSSHAEVYINEMRRAGIPVRYQTGSFLTSHEVQTALSLLRVLNNPTHDVPLMSLMLSPIFGFTPDEAAKIRLARRKGSLYTAVLAAEEQGDERAKNFLDTIREWRRLAVTLPVDRLLSTLYDRTGILDIVLSMEDGDRRNGNLLLLLQCAREFSENGGTLAGFPSYVEKTGEGQKPPVSVGGDAVNIMSFHGSKGLQFPVCIIAGCFHRFNKTDSTSSLVMDRHLGVAFKGLNAAENKRYNTVAREAIARAVAERNLSEELRVLYVALTRAEERLVVLLTAKDHKKKANTILKALKEKGAGEVISSAGSYYDWFMYSLLCGSGFSELRRALDIEVPDELITPGAPAAVFLGNPSSADETEESGSDETADDCRDILSRLEFTYPFADCVAAKAKISVSDIVSEKKDPSFEFTARPAFLSSKGLTPAQRGTATHKFMQFADYDAAAEDLNTELLRLKDMRFLTPEEADAVNLKELEKFFRSDLFSRMQGAVLHREMRFISEIPVGADEYDATVLQGVIDCVIDEGDSVTVVDFKTDRVSDENELKDRYAKQLDIYADSCLKLFGRPVKEKLIYSFALGKVITV
ncbi:MAG: UvrD-helicase domain-containing protein [Clostridia bacterium]|nr:UvrD-helicase domain-containing protein [Clostridia bacterium]